MKDSTILIVVGRDLSMNDLANKLESLRKLPVHVTVIVVNEMPLVPYYTYGIAPYGTAEVPVEWQTEVTSNKSEVAAKVAEIEGLLQKHDVSGGVSAISCEPAVIAERIARRAMLSDAVWVSEDVRERANLFSQVLYGVLFLSPVGVLLNDPDASALNNPETVFVAWNTQLQSARAVHQALPILRKANNVIIGTIDPVKTSWRDGEDPGVDVAKWLTRHGCNVTVHQYPSGGKDIGDCILSLAKEAGADLIVSGSYGHSRTREAIFGGTTRVLVEQTDQAVFMAH